MIPSEKWAKLRKFVTEEQNRLVALWNEADPGTNTEAFWDAKVEACADLLDMMEALDNA